MPPATATFAPVRVRWLKRSVGRRLASTFGLICADVLSFLTGYYLFRHGHGTPVILLPGARGLPNFGNAIDIYLILGVVFVFIRYLRGDYGKRQLFWDGARGTTSTLALAAVPDISFVVLIGVHRLYLPLALSWLFLIPIIPLYRQGLRYLLALAGLWQIPTAVVGSGKRASVVYESLRDTLSLGFDLRYLVVEQGDRTIPDELRGLRRMSFAKVSDIGPALGDLECSQVIVAGDDAKSMGSDLIQHLIGADIEVAIVPTLQGLPLFGISTNYLFGQDMLLLQLRNNLARAPSRAVKRIIDLVGPILALLLASPLWLLAMVAIKLADGGPIFFVQQRVGYHGKRFGCVKFRTMQPDAQETLTRWKGENPELYSEYCRSNFKLQNDPRITPVGKWLRRFSLDELPQILNVLAGQMSLVGPRPLIPTEISEYGAGFELYCRTLPGITGLWQISGRSQTKFSDRVTCDEWYVLNWSLWYDFVILLQTVRIVFTGRGAY
jgi:Undecaprenyl-phosphate galactose phosphotransferase WbaP